MRQRAGEVPFLDVEMQVLVTAALHRGDEVGKVGLILAPRPGAQLLAVVVEGHAGGIVRGHRVSVRAPPDVGHAEGAGGQAERDRRLDLQAANVGDQQGVVPLEDRQLAVGHVAVVHVAEPAAEAHDPPRQLVLAQAPAGLVELVRVLVAEVAVPGDVVPVPVVVEFLPRGHHGGGRPSPEVEVHAGGNRGRGIDEADALAPLVAQGMGHLHGAEFPALHEIDRFPHAGHAPTLHPHLADAAELAGPLRHHPAFFERATARLLHIHVLAGLHGPDGHHGVPVVRGGDRDRVDVAAVEQPADVGRELRHPPPVLKMLLAEPNECAGIAVAHGDEIALGVGEPFAHVCAALTVDADHRHAKPLVGAGLGTGRRGFGSGIDTGQGRGGQAEGGGDEIAAVQRHGGGVRKGWFQGSSEFTCP